MLYKNRDIKISHRLIACSYWLSDKAIQNVNILCFYFYILDSPLNSFNHSIRSMITIEMEPFSSMVLYIPLFYFRYKFLPVTYFEITSIWFYFKRLTGAFQQYDVHKNGNAHFTYEQYLSSVINSLWLAQLKRKYILNCKISFICDSSSYQISFNPFFFLVINFSEITSLIINDFI